MSREKTPVRVVAAGRDRCYRPGPMATVKPPLNAKELRDIKKRLLDERKELETQLTTIEEEAFSGPQSEMAGDPGFDDENADAGTSTFERERDLSIENNVRDLIRKIDDALGRIQKKTYGICEICGKAISKTRIEALPYAELCIKDAQAQSRSR